MITAHSTTHRTLSIALAAAAGALAATLVHLPLRRRANTLAYCHFGIYAPAAIRYELARLNEPCDVLVIDIRKMHDLNEVLGYEAVNQLIGNLVRTRNAPGRADMRGQWGGDEFVIAVPVGDGWGLLERLLGRRLVLSDAITEAQRHELTERTNGRVDGLHFAACLLEGVDQPLAAVERGIEVVTKLKGGHSTGERSTSGAIGTLYSVLASV